MYYILNPLVVETLAQGSEENVAEIIKNNEDKNPVLYVDDNILPLVKMINTMPQLQGALIACDDLNHEGFIRIAWEYYNEEKSCWMADLPPSNASNGKKSVDTSKLYRKEDSVELPEIKDYSKESVEQVLVVKFDQNDEAKSFEIVNEILATTPTSGIQHIVSDDRGNITYIIISYLKYNN